MGHTLPSTTETFLKEFTEFKPLYYALRRHDQLILDKFFEAILQHRAAIGNAINAENLLPMEIVPMIILLEERRRNSHIHNELYNLIEDLEKRLNQISLPEERQDMGS